MIKVKADPVHTMKACGGVDVKPHVFLISAIDVGGWTDSYPSCFTAKERATGMYRLGGGWNPGRVWKF